MAAIQLASNVVSGSANSAVSVKSSSRFSLSTSFHGSMVSSSTEVSRRASRANVYKTECATAVSTDPVADLASDESVVYNFAAGPATLPKTVLKKAQADLVDWNGCGVSVLEMSHRSKEFLSIIRKAESDLRTLLSVPEDYSILFVQGGATSQFSAVPLNIADPEDVVDFVVTGSWGDKAFKEAKKYVKPNLAVSTKAEKYTLIPETSTWNLTPGAKYVHICANETIQGVEFKEYPNVGDAILVADMSSNFCSKPVDVSKFGIIYAGAQKNVGPSGVTIVIVRKDLLGKSRDIAPVMFDYQTAAENESLYNTPPCFAIYIAGLVFSELLELGGLEAVAKRNEHKAGILYQAIDESSGFYKCPVERSVRSLMNVPFTMATPELEAAFLKEAASLNLIQLKGHRSVGGIRASIYNAMPLAGVEKLVSLMKSFQSKHTS